MNKLVKSNITLATTNSELVSALQNERKKNQKLMNICGQIYDGLSMKSKRSIGEECWHDGLKNILTMNRF